MADRQTALDALQAGMDALFSTGVSPNDASLLFRQMIAHYPQLVDFREVCENLYDGIHITDGEGTVLFINQAYTRTTGILPEEILGRKVSDIETEGKLYRGSVTAKVLERRERVNSVATIHKLNKEVLVTGSPVFDEAGNIKLVVTNTRDFPELKRLEQQLLTLTEESKKANEELAYLRRQQAGDKTILYRSQAMASVMALIRTIAPTDVTVLITGESGTGKELAANEIYQCSDRMGKPFIKVNCAAIPAELLESELFGYEEGAFTGAKRAGKAGMFELANTGVILLDEIGDMPLPLQTKLLRVLQQRELMRIGGSKPIPLDIRVIASTNKDLREEVRQGRFREDLYYRLNVVPIELKPLRERREDIPYLTEQFCRGFNKKYGKNAQISSEGMELILAYNWPGNIRELENLVERIVVTSSGGLVTRGSVYNALNPGGRSPAGRPEEDLPLRQQVAAYEREDHPPHSGAHRLHAEGRQGPGGGPLHPGEEVPPVRPGGPGPRVVIFFTMPVIYFTALQMRDLFSHFFSVFPLYILYSYILAQQLFYLSPKHAVKNFTACFFFPLFPPGRRKFQKPLGPKALRTSSPCIFILGTRFALSMGVKNRAQALKNEVYGEMKKTIITVATTGAWPKKENNPNVPMTPAEIAEDVYACWKAGAAVAHLHMRDDAGNGTMDKNKFRETVELLRKNHPDCDIILNMTTSGDLNATDETRQAHLQELRPEMGSYDCGSMNWLNSSLFINHPKFLEELGQHMQEWGVKPEIEAFDPGMIANAAYYLKKGVLKAPLHFQFCMGCANGIPGTMKNLVFMKETMESLCPGSTWSCFGVGHSAMEMLYGAVALGGHIRVGMEDNVMYAKGQLAESNVQFVERAARVIREYGNEVATPDEAREILGLKK